MASAFHQKQKQKQKQQVTGLNLEISLSKKLRVRLLTTTSSRSRKSRSFMSLKYIAKIWQQRIPKDMNRSKHFAAAINPCWQHKINHKLKSRQFIPRSLILAKIFPSTNQDKGLICLITICYDPSIPHGLSIYKILGTLPLQAGFVVESWKGNLKTRLKMVFAKSLNN